MNRQWLHSPLHSKKLQSLDIDLLLSSLETGTSSKLRLCCHIGVTLIETTDGEYIDSSQQSFIELQYGFSGDLYEQSQGRMAKVVLRKKSKGCWIVEESITYWKEISHYKDFTCCSISYVKNDNYFVNVLFIFIHWKKK